MTDPTGRRPLASRSTRWAGVLTRALAQRNVTPNQISQASIVAALIAGGAFWATALTSNAVTVGCLLVLAAAACQLRLLCNLLDGMVAIEAGKAAPDGPVWNEFPDRISDILIFAGVGFGIGAPALGFAAATMAVLTAYTRELGTGIGFAADFSGPMAKPHRMALITVAAILSIFETGWVAQGTLLTVALWVVVAGAAATSVSRARRLRRHLLER